jgi:hypothetical protein
MGWFYFFGSNNTIADAVPQMQYAFELIADALASDEAHYLPIVNAIGYSLHNEPSNMDEEARVQNVAWSQAIFRCLLVFWCVVWWCCGVGV